MNIPWIFIDSVDFPSFFMDCLWISMDIAGGGTEGGVGLGSKSNIFVIFQASVAGVWAA